MKTQHICPLCGVAMYETGGQITVFGKFAAVFFLGLAVSFAMTISGIGGGGTLLTIVFALLINAAVAYGLYRIGRKFLKK